MNTSYRLQTLTIITLCITLFWGAFGLDTVINPSALRFPLHRAFILMTSIIFLFNIQQVLNICQNSKTLVFLILFTLVSAIWAGNPVEVVKDFTFLSTSMLITILSVLAFNESRIKLIRWLYWLFLLMTLASIFIALVYPQLGINIRDFGKPRWIGITSHPNGLGTLAGILIWLSCNLYILSKNKLEKLLVLFSILIAFFVIIKADSMTNIITSFIVIALTIHYTYLSRVNKSIKVLVVISLIFFSIIFVTFFISPDEIINTAFNSAGRSSNFSGRTRLWSVSFKALSDHLLFGYGFDNLELLTKRYHIQMSHLHNGYIELIIKGGIIAGVLLFIILLKTYFNLLKINSPSFLIIL